MPDPKPKSDAKAVRQEKAANVLAFGGTVSQAADAGRVDQRTVRRWLTEPEFKRQIHELRTEFLSATDGRLAMLSARAAAVLGDLMEDAEAGPGIRLQAARSILESAHRIHETAELSAAVDDLRRELETLKSGNGNPNPTGSPAPGSDPPAQASRQSDAGSDPPRPDQNHGDGGEAAGPLANPADPPLF